MPTASERPTNGISVLARAVVWQQLALGWSPPAGAVRRRFTGNESRNALTLALQQLDLPSFDGEWAGDTELAFTRLFGHTVRAEICPYETEYGVGSVFRQTQELADLQGTYAAFGLVRSELQSERPDHLGVECEFAGFLCLKESCAREAGETDQAGLAQEAYRRFLRDHLARFGIAVTRRIERADATGFYGALARLCRAMLTLECTRLDIEKGPRALPLRPDAEETFPAACGAGSECSTAEPEGSSPLGRAAPRRLLSIGEGDEP